VAPAWLAAVGPSWQLRQCANLARRQHDPLVEDPRCYAESLSVRAVLRRAWHRHGAALARHLPAGIDTRLRMPTGSIGRATRVAASFGALWQDPEAQRAATRAEGPQRVKISHALIMLRTRVRGQHAVGVQGASNTSMR